MQNEEELHQIIKEKLEDFRPEISTSDWESMRRKILITKALRFAFPSLVVGVIILGFYLFESRSEVSEIKKNELITGEKVIEKVEILSKEEAIKTPKNQARKTKKIEAKVEPLSQEPVFPELFNETSNLPIEVSVDKLSSKNYIPNNKINDFAEKEIRVMSASAVAMSERISRVRELGKTYELTSYNTLERNIDKWKNVVIVCDITTSMFAYTTQVFDWILENKENTTIKGIVFFTDCDSLGRQAISKRTAKMFTVKNREEAELWDTMFAAIDNTENNKDSPENNIEALIYAQKNFPEANEIVLIADNSSSVKDIDKLSKVKKPVHVIACSETFMRDLAFQPDFVKIAKKTKGTIHTNEDDISDLSKISEGIIVRVGKNFFRYNKGKFYRTKFKIRP